jgi:exopolysaccharide biosynthesis polyprenyl glycosylphosphotransferase
VLGLSDVVAAALVLVGLQAGFGKPGPLVALGLALTVLPVGKLTGLYDRSYLRLANSTMDEVPLLMTVTGLSALVAAIVDPTLTGPGVAGARTAIIWGALFFVIACQRALLRAFASRLSPPERCLVIGDVEEATRIQERLRMGQTRASVVAALPLIGNGGSSLSDVELESVIARLVRELDAERIIVAHREARQADATDLIRAAKAAGVRVSLLAGALDMLGSTVEFDDVHGLTLVGFRSFGLSPSSRLLKRSFDLALASLGLIAVSPLLFVIAMAIKRDSHGPMFFRQIRVGRSGERFEIFKFRSMVADADAQKESLRAFSEAGDGLFKISNDPRVTRVGRFLRRSSLDELPQLFNVLRGEMSLVGPRPLVVEEDEEIHGLDRSRLALPPGMTGPWQVLPTRLPKRDMVELDYRYADNWSLWLDLKILIRTAAHVLRRGNH